MGGDPGRVLAHRHWSRHFEHLLLTTRARSRLAAEVGFDPRSGLAVELLAGEPVASRPVGDLSGDPRSSMFFGKVSVSVIAVPFSAAH